MKRKSAEFSPDSLTKVSDETMVALCRADPKEREALRLMLDHMIQEYPDADHSKWQISRVLNALKD